MSPKETALLAFGLAAMLILVGVKANWNTKHPVIAALFVVLALTMFAWGPW